MTGTSTVFLLIKTQQMMRCTLNIAGQFYYRLYPFARNHPNPKITAMDVSYTLIPDTYMYFTFPPTPLPCASSTVHPVEPITPPIVVREVYFTARSRDRVLI